MEKIQMRALTWSETELASGGGMSDPGDIAGGAAAVAVTTAGTELWAGFAAGAELGAWAGPAGAIFGGLLGVAAAAAVSACW